MSCHRKKRATETLQYAVKYRSHWKNRSKWYWLLRLWQEVFELSFCLMGLHDDNPEHELRQIGSIAMNFPNTTREGAD